MQTLIDLLWVHCHVNLLRNDSSRCCCTKATKSESAYRERRIYGSFPAGCHTANVESTDCGRNVWSSPDLQCMCVCDVVSSLCCVARALSMSDVSGLLVPAFQARTAPTCSSTTCPRSLVTRTSCRCSCPLETWCLPKSSLTNRPTSASALVSLTSPRLLLWFTPVFCEVLTVGTGMSGLLMGQGLMASRNIPV